MMQLIGLILVLLSYSAFAHVDAFTISKNINPKNVLHYEAIVKDCKLVEPYVDVYWIVGEEDGREGKLKFYQGSLAPKILDYANEYEAEFTLKALKGIKIEGAKSSFIMRMVNCAPKAYVIIEGREIELTEIYASMKYGIKVEYIVIKGKYPDGSEFKQKIDAN